MNRMFPLCLAVLLAAAHPADGGVKVLFLGDDGPHKPAERFAQLEPVMKQRGIDLTYTGRMSDLNPETLSR